MQTKTLPELEPSDISRFWDKVDKKEKSECWEWQACKRAGEWGGYGLFGIGGGEAYSAHRVSYKIATGIDPKDKLICHHCDNPACVNPNHLFLGTQSKNVQDSIKKGRDGFDQWPNNTTGKLSKDQVLEIIELLEKGNLLQREIAERFEICQPQISAIKMGKTYVNITGGGLN